MMERSRGNPANKLEEILSCIEQPSVPVFYGPESKWQLNEEVVLLTLICYYNNTNWSELAKMLSERFHKHFTPDEVREHYMDTYVDGDIAKAMRPKKGYSKLQVQDHTTEEHDELLDCKDLNAYENVPSDFLKEIGYLPLRGDFVEEYDKDAEDLLYYVNFTYVDLYDEKVNFLLLDTYRHKLKERFRLKKAIKEFRLIERYYEECQKNPKYKVNAFFRRTRSYSRTLRDKDSDNNNDDDEEEEEEETEEEDDEEEEESDSEDDEEDDDDDDDDDDEDDDDEDDNDEDDEDGSSTVDEEEELEEEEEDEDEKLEVGVGVEEEEEEDDDEEMENDDEGEEEEEDEEEESNDEDEEEDDDDDSEAEEDDEEKKEEDEGNRVKESEGEGGVEKEEIVKAEKGGGVEQKIREAEEDEKEKEVEEEEGVEADEDEDEEEEDDDDEEEDDDDDEEEEEEENEDENEDEEEEDDEEEDKNSDETTLNPTNGSDLETAEVQSQVSGNRRETASSTKRVKRKPFKCELNADLTEAEKKLCSNFDISQPYYAQYKAFLMLVDYQRRCGKFVDELIVPPQLTVAQWLGIVNFLVKGEYIDVETKDLLNVEED